MPFTSQKHRDEVAEKILEIAYNMGESLQELENVVDEELDGDPNLKAYLVDQLTVFIREDRGGFMGRDPNLYELAASIKNRTYGEDEDGEISEDDEDFKSIDIESENLDAEIRSIIDRVKSKYKYF